MTVHYELCTYVHVRCSLKRFLGGGKGECAHNDFPPLLSREREEGEGLSRIRALFYHIARQPLQLGRSGIRAKRRGRESVCGGNIFYKKCPEKFHTKTNVFVRVQYEAK